MTMTLHEMGLVKEAEVLVILDANGIDDPAARLEALDVARRESAPQPLRAVGYDAQRIQRWCEGDL